jgi:hypothetical protein
LSWEVEKLQSQLSRQEVQVNFLIEDLKSIGDEFLVKKKEESALLVNAIKEKLDESLHGYLEIFLDVQIGDNITEIVKKSLHGKINERELRQLSTKKVEIIRLERQLTKLTNLQNQENQQQTFLQARIQIPPK